MNFALNIEKSCRLYPDKTCVIQEDIRLTFNQMEERANACQSPGGNGPKAGRPGSNLSNQLFSVLRDDLCHR